MIEYHIVKAGRPHVLTDDDGWQALIASVGRPSTPAPSTGAVGWLTGLDVYRGECPCRHRNATDEEGAA